MQRQVEGSSDSPPEVERPRVEVVGEELLQKDGDAVCEHGPDRAERRDGVEGNFALEREESEAEREPGRNPDRNDGGFGGGVRPVEETAEGDGLVAGDREELEKEGFGGLGLLGKRVEEP